MPTAYRIEVSSTNRAVCRNKECKDAQIKLQKGELRFGVLVEIQEHQSWHWRHWGCVTPQVLANISDFINGDMEMFDGYEDLPEEDQEKVTRAVEQGHVDDEDWRGDVEKNRPGEKGFRLTKKQAAKGKAEEDAEEEPNGASAKGKKKRKAKKTNDDESEPEAPPPKKKRGAVKKEDPDEEAVTAPNIKKPRTKVVKKEDADDAEDIEINAAQPAKKARAKKVKSENTDDTVAQPAPVAKKSRAQKSKQEESSEVKTKAALPAKKARTKNTLKQDDENDDGALPAGEAPQPTRKPTKSKKGTVTATNEEAINDDITDPIKGTKAKTARAGTSRTKKTKQQDEPSVPASDAEPTEPLPKKKGRGRKKTSAGDD